MSASVPYNIFLIGPMGAGKTSIGRQLAKRLDLKFYDSDQVIEERTGADIPWIYDIEGEAGFQLREMKVIAELTALENILLATGGGTVMTSENRELLVDRGIIVYLKTSLDDQIERIKRSKKRPLVAESVSRRDLLTDMRRVREPIYESLANISCSTDRKALNVVVNEILRGLHDKYQIDIS